MKEAKISEVRNQLSRSMRPVLWAAFALALTPACARQATTPEERVRAVLASLEEGAQERDAEAMKGHVSEGYADAQGNDKRAIAGLVTFHVLRNQSIHLFTRVLEVAIDETGEARAEVLVAMAGTPIPAPEALAGIRADLYRFEIHLREEEDAAWRVTRATWRRVSEPGAAPDG